MSLASASEARKERLLALRRKRAGEDVQDARYVTTSFFSPWKPKVWSGPSSGDATQPALINRNFDPETRTLRKHQTNVEMEDTLESNVKGLAEEIIAEDEAKRAQDLVTAFFFHWNFHPIHPTREGSSEYCTKTAKLGSQKRNGEEIGEIGKADSAGHPYAHS
jgi:hypothetical protein